MAVYVRALEPADLPALAALCARPEIAAELDEIPGDTSLQSAPGVNSAVGAFEDGRLLGAAGMAAVPRVRMRHVGRAWLATEPSVASELLEALRGLAADWWHLDRLELIVPASSRMGAALGSVGFQPEVLRRLDLVSPEGREDSVGYAWVRDGLAATPAARTFARGPARSLPPSFQIRPSRPEDAAGFVGVYADPSVIWGTLQTPFTPVESWRLRLASNDPAKGRSFVAVVDDQVVGTCNLQNATSPRRRHVWILGMGVAAAWQGRGVGRAMMRHLTELADSMEVERVELDVYADNDRAIALYEKHGFVREGVKWLEAWRGGAYVDALVMARVR